MSNLYQPFIKTVSINDLPESAWQYITGQPTETKALQDYYKAIPWLFRGVDIRADAVASMPFKIYRGETEVDSSDDYKNIAGFLPEPGKLFGLIEAALTIWSYAYAFKKRNEFISLGVRYLLPTSVKPKITADGEISFTRREGNKDVPYTTDDIIYFWQRDPFVEIGPPQASPATAAASAAGVLLNTDKFAAAFFERGAIKATLLTTQNILPQERDRLKSWWARMFGSGVKSAWQTDIVNAETVKPVVVGEGIESLENATLTESKRVDIAAALGIPYSVLFSNASNRATAEQDDKHLYTKTIVPECRFIESVLNTQLFEDAGLRFKFDENSLDLFQTDENERAQSLTQLVAALEKPEEFLLASEILGYDIPEDIKKRIEKMITEKAERAAEIQANMANAQNRPPEPGQPAQEQEQPAPQMRQPPPNNRSIDLDKWQRKAEKALKVGKPAAVPFESEEIPQAIREWVSGHLKDCKTAGDVAGVFSQARTSEPLFFLTEELKRANDLLEATANA